MKKIVCMVLCLAMLFTNVCYAGDFSKNNNNSVKEKIYETKNENGNFVVNLKGDNYFIEGSYKDSKYEINIPKDIEKKYSDYCIITYDESGNPEETISFDEDNNLINYNHKTGETTYPLKDGSIIYYAPGEDPKDLSFPELETNANRKNQLMDLSSVSSISTMSSTPYYTDYTYSYEISPVGSQLVYRSATKSDIWTLVNNNITIGTWYFGANVVYGKLETKQFGR